MWYFGFVIGMAWKAVILGLIAAIRDTRAGSGVPWSPFMILWLSVLILMGHHHGLAVDNQTRESADHGLGLIPGSNSFNR